MALPMLKQFENDYGFAIVTRSDWLQNCATFSNNEKQDRNQSLLVRMIFPALWASCK